MRRKLAALLCALMCITAFTGCSQAELGYLKMSVDMMKNMKVVESQGNMKIQADFDAMKTFVTDVTKTAGGTDEQVTNALAGMESLTGKKEAVLDYKIKMDMETLDFMFDLDLTYNGKQYAMGDMYYSLTKGVYVSTETVWGIYQMAKDMTTDKESFMFSDAFAKDLKASLDADKYICIMSMAEMGLTEAEIAQMVPQGGYASLYDSVLEFYGSAFKDFSTNMVTEVSGGYQVKTDGKAVAKLFVDVLDYIGNNPDTVISATTKYMMDVMKTIGATEEDLKTFETEMNSMVADKEQFSTMMKSLSQSLSTALADAAVTKVLDSFSYESTVTKNGDAFVSKETCKVTNGGKDVLTITSDAKTKAASGKISMPATSVTMEKVTADVTVLADKYNPVTGVTVMWGEAMGDTGILNKERAEFSWLTNDSDVVDYVVKDGRVYLPLRDICEAMGETVEWNQATKTASVVRGTEKTAMTGVVEGTQSFVMVRDFEKLGYKVDYRSAEGVKEATVTKAK